MRACHTESRVDHESTNCAQYPISHSGFCSWCMSRSCVQMSRSRFNNACEHRVVANACVTWCVQSSKNSDKACYAQPETGPRTSRFSTCASLHPSRCVLICPSSEHQLGLPTNCCTGYGLETKDEAKWYWQRRQRFIKSPVFGCGTS